MKKLLTALFLFACLSTQAQETAYGIGMTKDKFKVMCPECTTQSMGNGDTYLKKDVGIGYFAYIFIEDVCRSVMVFPDRDYVNSYVERFNSKFLSVKAGKWIDYSEAVPIYIWLTQTPDGNYFTICPDDFSEKK